MEVDYDCTLHYCIAEELKPSSEVVAARGTFTGVSAGTKFRDAVAAVKEAAEATVVFRLSPGDPKKNRAPVWAPITPHVLEYICKPGDVFYFKALPARGPEASRSLSPVPSWEDERMLAALAKQFNDSALVARTRPTPAVETDLGQEFKITGRTSTFYTLLKGATTMYQRYLRPINSLVGYQRDKPFFFGMIAFPGAGKTTMSTRGWVFLSEQWSSISPRRKSALLSDLNPEERVRFEAMCKASLKYNLCMYHDVADDDGDTCRDEQGLHPVQILGLRSLAAVLDRRDYEEFLKEVDTLLPGA